MLEAHVAAHPEEYATEQYAGFSASGDGSVAFPASAALEAEELQRGSFRRDAGGVLAADYAGGAVATEQVTMVTAINDAIASALRRDERTVVLGEDVGFGGVFRATAGLRDEFGAARVMNTPVSEQGIVAFAVGLSVAGSVVFLRWEGAVLFGSFVCRGPCDLCHHIMSHRTLSISVLPWLVPSSYKTVAEIQFADYIFPAFDQIVNEIAKYRSRTGGRGGHCGNIVIRAPCGSVGHGSMYHSQSVEAYFAHCPGLTVVVPRGPRQAKGLLSAAINCDDPVLFFEPKALYRANFEGSEGEVPVEDYTLPLGVADVVAPGEDVTLIGWGNQVARLEDAATRAAKRDGISCEVIDLQTIVPWDIETVVASVKKTGRCIVSHEAPSTNGFGAELAASITEECFLHLEAPVTRVCGLDTHFPYAWEEFYLPSASRVHAAIKKVVEY